MHFEFEQMVKAPREIAERAFLDPSFYALLNGSPDVRISDLSAPVTDGATTRLEVRYIFTRPVGRAARLFVDPAKLTWIVHAEARLARHTWVFVLEPDHYADRVKLQYSYKFLKHGDVTRQVVEGDLSLRVPVGGGAVERAIADGVRSHMSAEAAAIEVWAATAP
ncbi:MAG: hypothetical protein JWM85_3342 [Acidimicrobiaceae bacterium]|nr:hypothetical protein [Acidimicrobiaceae bacterium]